VCRSTPAPSIRPVPRSSRSGSLTLVTAYKENASTGQGGRAGAQYGARFMNVLLGVVLASGVLWSASGSGSARLSSRSSSIRSSRTSLPIRRSLPRTSASRASYSARSISCGARPDG
jgi:hypothetical protein